MRIIDIWGPIEPDEAKRSWNSFSSVEMKYALDCAAGEAVHVRIQCFGGVVVELPIAFVLVCKAAGFIAGSIPINGIS